MSASIEHRKIVDFVAGFKAANKNTVERVRTFDPKLKTWTFEVVQRDENASKFSEELKISKRRQKEKEKRMKSIPDKKNASPGEKKMPTKPKSKMRLNVVRLHNEGLIFKQIGKMYGVSENSARLAYHKEMNNK
ncbi:hypothetical protein [Chryseobacterium sp. 2R14A]|uniref:hypothetical protein n=1 Tax=Chryseobacterium sp. 2R14A TaxID=3380353 RepID=UPI003CEC20C4